MSIGVVLTKIKKFFGCATSTNVRSNVELHVGSHKNKKLGKMMSMEAGSCYIPKFGQGEDAHFICIDELTIGVADGVGGWKGEGIDAGEFSRTLMRNALSSVQKQKSGHNNIHPRKILNDAFIKTKSVGSSTACIFTIVGDILHAVNVGDSGFVVIRDGSIIYKSEVQHKRFSCPFQLGNDRLSDKPGAAQEFEVQVKLGDVVVMGTDGLFDNVHDSELEILVREYMNSHELKNNTETLARNIAEYALKNSKDEKLCTPFAKECIDKTGVNRVGGKLDDITVIVAHILPL